MMIAPLRCGLTILLALSSLTGCSTPAPQTQQATATPGVPPRPFQMTLLCIDKASYRYNTDRRGISVVDIESFQRSYELRGYTVRDEGFTCTFDEKGAFLHLSMR